MMQVPDKWDMGARELIHLFINRYGFATVVSIDLEGSHLPLLLIASEGENGTLYGHFACSNPHWKSVAGTRVLCIFSGPHAYLGMTPIQRFRLGITA
jgi:transcriptional regulator